MRLKGSERDTQTGSQSFVRNQRPPSSLTSIKLSNVSRSFGQKLTLCRYLVPNDLTAYHFNYIIRKRIRLPEKDSLYFFVNGKYLLKGGK